MNEQPPRTFTAEQAINEIKKHGYRSGYESGFIHITADTRTLTTLSVPKDGVITQEAINAALEVAALRAKDFILER